MRDRCLPHGGSRHLTRVTLVMDQMAQSALLGNGEERADAIEPNLKAGRYTLMVVYKCDKIRFSISVL
jgi:hypothetical protein